MVGYTFLGTLNSVLYGYCESDALFPVIGHRIRCLLL